MKTLGHFLSLLSCFAFILEATFPVAAFANPQGGVVAAGQADISSSGKNLTVNQSSDKAIIDWRSFNIAPDEATRFNQPNSSSITANRINDINPSKIEGSLTANGNIVLINPNGVFFTKDARVDVNGLIASTANISNSAFMNSGKLEFNMPGDPNASIINEGLITAKDAGLVGLVAPNVFNRGIINAKLGTVNLASGDTFTLDLYGDGLMNFKVSDAVQNQLVENTGKVNAAGGNILITAAAGSQVVDSLITIKGELNAPAAEQKNGRIRIFAEGSNAVAGNIANNKGVKSGSSKVEVSGKLNASGYGAGESGGKIRVLGDNVDLTGAQIDASGNTGGGDVRIGGNYKGESDTPTAMNTNIDAATVIKNNATGVGNAGRTIIWADGTTNYLGKIFAQAFVLGMGGFVETSGKQHLLVRGSADLTSANGSKGTWLLDPTTYTILNRADTPGVDELTAADIEAMSVGADVALLADDTITFDMQGDTLTLTSGRNLTFSTTNLDITTASSGSIIASGNGSITFAAGRDINLQHVLHLTTSTGDVTLRANNSIINTGGGDITTSGGNVVLNSNRDGVGAGSIDLSTGSNITTGGGDITLGGGNAPGSTNAIGTATNIYGVLVSGSVLNAGGGDITLRGTGTAAGAANNNFGTYLTGGTLQTTSGGTINLFGTGGSVNNSGNVGVVLRSGSALLAENGSVNIEGTGGFDNGSLNAYGVYFINTGNITMTGTGAINVTGISSDASSIAFAGAGSVLGGASGNITFNADYLTLTTAPTIVTTGDMYIRPYLATTTVSVGNSVYELAITSAALANITAANVYIGRNDGQVILDITGMDLSAENYNLHLLNGSGNIVLNGGVTALTMGNNDSFSATTTTGDIVTAANGSVVTTGTGTIGLTAGNDLDLSHDLDLTSDTGAVTLRANRDILIDGGGDITTNGGNVILNSDRDASGVGAINLGIGTNLVSAGGNITLGGGANPETTYARANGFTHGITMNQAGINAGGGNIIMSGQGLGSGSNSFGGILQSSTVSTTGSGTILGTFLGGQVGGGSSNNRGMVMIEGSSFLTQNGNLTINATGGTGSGGNNHAIHIVDTGNSVETINATGSGRVILNATGGEGASEGLLITSTSTIHEIGGVTNTGGVEINASSARIGQANIRTSGAGSLSFTGAVEVADNMNLSTTNGNITFGSTINSYDATPRNLTLSSTNGNVSIAGSMGGTFALGDVSITSAGSITLPAVTVNSLFVETTGVGSDITLGGNLSALTNNGDTLTLVSADDFFNAGNYTITTAGTGRYLIYSEVEADNNEGGLTPIFREYSCTHGGACNVLPATGNGFLYTGLYVAPAAPGGGGPVGPATPLVPTPPATVPPVATTPPASTPGTPVASNEFKIPDTVVINSQVPVITAAVSNIEVKPQTKLSTTAPVTVSEPVSTDSSNTSSETSEEDAKAKAGKKTSSNSGDKTSMIHIDEALARKLDMEIASGRWSE